jgi:hypothetical protein
MWAGMAADIGRVAISENQNTFAEEAGQTINRQMTDLPVGQIT